MLLNKSGFVTGHIQHVIEKSFMEGEQKNSIRVSKGGICCMSLAGSRTQFTCILEFPKSVGS